MLQKGHANPDAVRLSHLKLQRDPADDDFVAKFSKLVDDDLNYRVRLPANVLHPRADEHVVAYVPSRCLADAGLQENFALHMDERGNVVGVDYTTAGGECHADTPAVPLGKDPKFRTTAAVRERMWSSSMARGTSSRWAMRTYQPTAHGLGMDGNRRFRSRRSLSRGGGRPGSGGRSRWMIW